MTSPLSSLLGPGSQPSEEDVVLEYMEMPSDMMSYHMPALPELEDTNAIAPALARLDAVLVALKSFGADKDTVSVTLTDLDAANRAFIDEVLGEGEVSIVGGERMQAQESVLAGVWRVRETGPDGTLPSDRIEVGRLPRHLAELAFAGAAPAVRPPDGVSAEGLLAAPSLLAEIHNVLLTGTAPHAINLSLLPHTEEDLALLDSHLGRGPVHILSRGYGNCRISSTATRHVWWVRYYNSQDTLILNSLEVAEVPDVALASPEDLEDSAQRLAEILGVYR
jgi:hydrogenase-1 operon protein HyaF